MEATKVEAEEKRSEGCTTCGFKLRQTPITESERKSENFCKTTFRYITDDERILPRAQDLRERLPSGNPDFLRIRKNHGVCKKRKPCRIILIRHGESEANVDTNVYSHKPDNKIELTDKGKAQAQEAGRKLKDLLHEESTVYFYVSPYNRSKETFENVLIGSGYNKKPERWFSKEEPFLREQEWGNYQRHEQKERIQKERREIGSFYYRFPEGESGGDVYDRVDRFWSVLHRQFKNNICDTFVIISHGITLRLFLMRYFHWSIDEFQRLWNFENCQTVMMQLDEQGKHYSLTTPLKCDPKPDSDAHC